jgi:hypothetical protein
MSSEVLTKLGQGIMHAELLSLFQSQDALDQKLT